MSGPSEAHPGGGNMVPPCQCGNQRTVTTAMLSIVVLEEDHNVMGFRFPHFGPDVFAKMDEEDLLGLLGRSIQQACRDRVALSEIRNAVASSANAQGSGQPGFLPQHSPIFPFN
ncbi:uncharacterized protein EI90DRAFT_3024980 [Cantharellus anzutake]|uniref:uncharacterized protein n=1 Tax=Cantharellus anzutake TaxID=1750568 RepID=UPI001902FD16|nr:uncharacterized protein EI90DRAFT_3024980 [Cantharellus anzutake]KAF8309705.1 hypothetical protein EI90DRAFT_3024980 [Cantharellus anzutake]